MEKIAENLTDTAGISPSSALAVAGFLVSIAVAYWIYRKTLVDRSIAIVQFPIIDLTTSLKKVAVELSIIYGGKEVQSLGSIELRVENKGKFSFENLEVHVFANTHCEFLNASIVTNQEILAHGFRWQTNQQDKSAILIIPYMNSRTNALISLFFSGIPKALKVEPKINSVHKVIVVDSDRWVSDRDQKIKYLGIAFGFLSVLLASFSLYSFVNDFLYGPKKSVLLSKSFYDRIPDFSDKNPSLDSSYQVNPDKTDIHN